MQRGRRDSVAFTVVVGILVLLGGLAMALVIGLSGAPGSLALAAVLAAVPVGPLVGCFMWLDRYEPEPRSLLVAGLLWGAFVATAAALVFQGLGRAGGASERDSLTSPSPKASAAMRWKCRRPGWIASRRPISGRHGIWSRRHGQRPRRPGLRSRRPCSRLA